MRRAAVTLVLLGLLLSGCIKAKDDGPSATRAPSLGKKATIHEGGGGSSTTAAPGSSPITSVASGPTTTVATGTRSGGGGSAAATRLVDVADPSGDQGADGPAYADEVGLLIESSSAGTSMTIRVTMAAAVPAQLASGEVMGVGIDLYRPGQSESDYQVFADGESSGWTAYLQTPQGFVAYPGSFTLAGSTLTFTVPWSAVGDMRTGETSSFADWSRKTLLKTIAASDKAPDSSRAPFHR